ncbi:hypothetical protein IHE45_14G050700 [Dioscorea alata]|uniref:Uncharacterized protein n=1 Tax=Dioscorea alata TaxID=55571 RepID=A0ACB7URV9_DIOAL|nr:hypothetical protein IHE45_14G050700 [Dioscorea alata]
MGGLARHLLGGQRGTTRTARRKPGDRGTVGTTARAVASHDPRPRSEWPTGSHPDSPWPCGQCPERRGAPRAHPRRTQPRATPAPRRGRRGTVGARPLFKGGLARNHHTVVGRDRGTTRTTRQNRVADGRAAPPRARPRCPVTSLGSCAPRAATQTCHGRARHVPSD